MGLLGWFGSQSTIEGKDWQPEEFSGILSSCRSHFLFRKAKVLESIDCLKSMNKPQVISHSIRQPEQEYGS